MSDLRIEVEADDNYLNIPDECKARDLRILILLGRCFHQRSPQRSSDYARQDSLGRGLRLAPAPREDEMVGVHVRGESRQTRR